MPWQFKLKRWAADLLSQTEMKVYEIKRFDKQGSYCNVVSIQPNKS